MYSTPTNINFLFNESLDDQGALVSGVGLAPLRGEHLFKKSFPHQPNVSCASCHNPTTYFVDGETHDVGTGMIIDTPTLRDVSITAPYMHDGSLGTLDAVVQFYDRGGIANEQLDPLIQPLGLSLAERSNLVLFLKSLTGDGIDRILSDAFSAPIGNAE